MAAPSQKRITPDGLHDNFPEARFYDFACDDRKINVIYEIMSQPASTRYVTDWYSRWMLFPLVPIARHKWWLSRTRLVSEFGPDIQPKAITVRGPVLTRREKLDRSTPYRAERGQHTVSVVRTKATVVFASDYTGINRLLCVRIKKEERLYLVRNFDYTGLKSEQGLWDHRSVTSNSEKFRYIEHVIWADEDPSVFGTVHNILNAFNVYYPSEATIAFWRYATRNRNPEDEDTENEAEDIDSNEDGGKGRERDIRAQEKGKLAFFENIVRSIILYPDNIRESVRPDEVVDPDALVELLTQFRSDCVALINKGCMTVDAICQDVLSRHAAEIHDVHKTKGLYELNTAHIHAKALLEHAVLGRPADDRLHNEVLQRLKYYFKYGTADPSPWHEALYATNDTVLAGVLLLTKTGIQMMHRVSETISRFVGSDIPSALSVYVCKYMHAWWDQFFRAVQSAIVKACPRLEENLNFASTRDIRSGVWNVLKLLTSVQHDHQITSHLIKHMEKIGHVNERIESMIWFVRPLVEAITALCVVEKRRSPEAANILTLIARHLVLEDHTINVLFETGVGKTRVLADFDPKIMRFLVLCGMMSADEVMRQVHPAYLPDASGKSGTLFNNRLLVSRCLESMARNSINYEDEEECKTLLYVTIPNLVKTTKEDLTKSLKGVFAPLFL